MHPDIRIFHMYRRSDGIYMRPEGPDILTHQSASKNDSPSDPICIPITSGSMIMSEVWLKTNRLSIITATYYR